MNLLLEQALKTRPYTGLTAVVAGAGSSGSWGAALLTRLGARVRLADENEALDTAPVKDMVPGAELVLGEFTSRAFADASLVVLSPGVPLAKVAPFLGHLRRNMVVAELELASRLTAEPMVAVTGTNGKTTTVMLMAKAFEAAGKRAAKVGNIGTPLSRYLLEDDGADVLVVEASSFQLQTCRTLSPNAAVLLNFSANHLDWHADMAEYLEAKLKLFAAQGPDDLAVLPKSMKKELDKLDFTRARRVYFTATRDFSCPALPGSHNQANLAAAWEALRHMGVDEDTFAATLEEFTPPPHRLETVAEIHGVLYVDDSKATSVEAAAAALKTFRRPVRLLAGGQFKGGDMDVLGAAMRNKVVELGLFGGSREVFSQVLNGAFDGFWEPTLEKALRRLHASANPGDVILLSPATASFDQYGSYAERGDDFKRVVGELT